jgi:hypothetical protein
VRGLLLGFFIDCILPVFALVSYSSWLAAANIRTARDIDDDLLLTCYLIDDDLLLTCYLIDDDLLLTHKKTAPDTTRVRFWRVSRSTIL